MIRVRRTIIGDAYMLDNGRKAVRIDEDSIDRLGREIDPRWANDANPVIDMISTIEVGKEYMIDEIPERDGTVIMSTNLAATNWIVLVFARGEWHLGTSTYNIPDTLKQSKWKVLEV